MASLTIPVVSEIEAIYGLEGAAEATHRYQKLTAAFKQAYGDAPAVYARAPGRVNLIGEHIDYEGYGVLPMAIKQDTIVAIRKGRDKLVVANLESDKYPTIEFSTDPNQVRAADVQLPEGATFVVANSLTVSKKAETADRRYNLRVVECCLAAMLLAVALGKAASEAVSITTLKEVEPLIIGKYGPGAEAQDKAVREHLHEGVYTPEEIEGLLGKKLDNIYEGNASALRVLSVVGPEGFELRNRALHVYSEAGRVYAFRDVCKGDASNDEKLQQLGELLNASHTSCSQMYQCSCEELDTLVGVARAAGALGARLTGAGWGGCTVSLVREADAPKFIAELREKYFMPLVAKGVLTEQELPACLFASKPSSGAAVMQLKLAAEPEVEAAVATAEAAAV